MSCIITDFDFILWADDVMTIAMMGVQQSAARASVSETLLPYASGVCWVPHKPEARSDQICAVALVRALVRPRCLTTGRFAL